MDGFSLEALDALHLVGDPPAEPAEQLFEDVQGDILAGGFPKKHEMFMFFSIENPKDFCQALHLETTLKLFSTGSEVQNVRQYIKLARGMALQPLKLAFSTISFSARGLRKIDSLKPGTLDLDGPWTKTDQAFFKGMEADARPEDLSLGLRDPMGGWEPEYLDGKIDGLILVAGSEQTTITSHLKLIEATFGSSMRAVKTESGSVRPGKYKGFEHFGFNDNISQPTVEGFAEDNPKIPDKSVGELGDKWNTVPQSVILVQDANGLTRPAWTKNGSFLVFRKLEQDVLKFWTAIRNAALNDDKTAYNIEPNLLAAKLMGRWKSGCPVMVSTARDDPTQAYNNQFDFDENPRTNTNEALCPLGAHIRKMNPHRAQPDFNHTSRTNDARMLRRGIPYGNDLSPQTMSEKRGLHFICYQSSIEKSFRQAQRAWANFDDFPGPGAGVDVITGNLVDPDETWTAVANDDRGKKKSQFGWRGINQWVLPKGGEYLFTPTISALRDTLSTVA